MSDLVSIIVPVFNEEKNLLELYKRINLTVGKTVFELIFVDDGSTDRSWEIISKISKNKQNIRAISFSGNMGKSAALMSGFDKSKGNKIVTIDADLQDLPEEIPILLEKLTYFDLVVGWKRKRKDSFEKRFFSRIFNFLLFLFGGPKIHDSNCGLKAMTSEVANSLDLRQDFHRFIPFIAKQNKFSVGEVEVSHSRRKYGTSKYGRSRIFTGFFDLFSLIYLVTFKNKPLRLFGTIGLLQLVVGVILGFYLIFLWFQGISIGDRPLLLLAVFLCVSGIQFFGLGLIGESLSGFSNKIIIKKERGFR